jgi:hypothetical protein
MGSPQTEGTEKVNKVLRGLLGLLGLLAYEHRKDIPSRSLRLAVNLNFKGANLN